MHCSLATMILLKAAKLDSAQTPAPIAVDLFEARRQCRKELIAACSAGPGCMPSYRQPPDWPRPYTTSWWYSQRLANLGWVETHDQLRGYVLAGGAIWAGVYSATRFRYAHLIKKAVFMQAVSCLAVISTGCLALSAGCLAYLGASEDGRP